MMMRTSIWPLPLLVGVVLVGCSSSDSTDVHDWILQERNQIRPKVALLPPPKQFVPENYTRANDVEPFSSLKLTQALKRDSAQVASNAGLVAPELTRRKEALEDFPLDAMQMVGSITRTGEPMALLRVENLLYQVKLGNYLGQNYGRVTKISETGLSMREIVQDSGGEWIERVATLQLQEKTK